MADARASLDEVSEALGVDLAAEDGAEDIDTLGGLIVTLAGRVPSRGELIAGPGGLEFEVLDADPRRVKRVRILPPRPPPAAGAAHPTARGRVARPPAKRRRRMIAALARPRHRSRLAGWRRALARLRSPARSARSRCRPSGFFPALVVSPDARRLADRRRAPRAGRGRAPRARRGLIGWFWGFGYFVAGLWWLGAAFLVEADQFAWALPLGVLGLPALLAFFPAFGFALARLLWSRAPRRILALRRRRSTSAEWLRGHLFTGFPWNTLGMALGQNLWLMQGASVVGLYGLTLLAIAIARRAGDARDRPRRARERWTAPGLAARRARRCWRASAPGAIPAGPSRPVAGRAAAHHAAEPAAGRQVQARATATRSCGRYLALSDRATAPTAPASPASRI